MYGWNIGGTNSSGQVPEIDNFPSLIDSHTPDDAKTFTNSRGDEYKLVFSDEFNEDGRSFYPGGELLSFVCMGLTAAARDWLVGRTLC